MANEIHSNKKDSTKWFALIVVVIGTFMAILDSTIVNVAMPKMMAVFGVDYTTAKWIITAYSLTTGAVIPVTGYLTNVFGAKRVYIFALSVFTAGSMLCGFAGTIDQIILFRVMQALGGGMIMPVGLSMILELFEPHERGTALGIWGMSSSAAPMMGPTLGGAIVQYLDWRLIFNLNIPVGVVGVILAFVLLKGSGKIKFKKIDVVGVLTSTVGLVCLLYIFGEWSNIEWSNITLDNVGYSILLVLGIGSMLLFVLNELFHPDPLLDLRMFKIVSFTQSQVVICVLTLAMMGGVFILPLLFQDIQGMTAMQSGMMIMPSAITSAMVMAFSGKIYAKLGIRMTIIPGLILLFLASYFMAIAINVNTPKHTLIMLTIFRSVGMGLTMMPVTTYGMNTITGKNSAKASALANTIKQVFSAFSVTLMTALINNYNTVNYTHLAQQVTPFNMYIYGFYNKLQILLAPMAPGQASSVTLQVYVGLINEMAYVSAMSKAAGIMALVTIIAIIFAFFMKDKRNKI